MSLHIYFFQLIYCSSLPFLCLQTGLCSLIHLLFLSINPINSTMFKVLYQLHVVIHIFISPPLSGTPALFQLICLISFTCNFLVATSVSLYIEDSCLVKIVLYVCVVCFWCLGSIAIFEGFLCQDYKSRILIKRE